MGQIFLLHTDKTQCDIPAWCIMGFYITDLQPGQPWDSTANLPALGEAQPGGRREESRASQPQLPGEAAVLPGARHLSELSWSECNASFRSFQAPNKT